MDGDKTKEVIPYDLFSCIVFMIAWIVFRTRPIDPIVLTPHIRQCIRDVVIAPFLDLRQEVGF